MNRMIKPLIFLILALLVGFHFGEDRVRYDAKQILHQSLLFSIKGYKRYISPAGAPPCHFYPSCSIYTKQAIEKFGIIQGLLMGFDRLTRCHKDTQHYSTVWVNDQIKNLDFPEVY